MQKEEDLVTKPYTETLLADDGPCCFDNKTLSIEDNAWLPSGGWEEPCTSLKSWPSPWIRRDFELCDFHCWCPTGPSEHFTKIPNKKNIQ